MSVYVNGIPVWPEDAALIDPRDVAGVEVYRSALVAPRCGSIVVWEKDWRSTWDIDP